MDSVSSFGSASLYSAAGVTKGDYDISGEVLVGVEYKQDQLMVHVNRARGLAAADKNGLSDPSVELCHSVTYCLLLVPQLCEDIPTARQEQDLQEED